MTNDVINGPKLGRHLQRDFYAHYPRHKLPEILTFNGKLGY